MTLYGKILNEKKEREKNIIDNAKKKSMELIEEKAKLSDKYVIQIIQI